MRYTIAELLAIVSAVGIACAWPVLLVPMITVGASAFLGRKSPRVGVALAIVASSLYLPFGWLLLIDYDWGSYRLAWLNWWPVLPGFIAGIIFHPNEILECSAMGVTTLLLLVSLTWLGSGGCYRRSAAAAIALLTSVPQAFVSYAVFRAWSAKLFPEIFSHPPIFCPGFSRQSQWTTGSDRGHESRRKKLRAEAMAIPAAMLDVPNPDSARANQVLEKLTLTARCNFLPHNDLQQSKWTNLLPKKLQMLAQNLPSGDLQFALSRAWRSSNAQLERRPNSQMLQPKQVAKLKPREISKLERFAAYPPLRRRTSTHTRQIRQLRNYPYIFSTPPSSATDSFR
jgi:hypothetical protein